MQQNFLLYCYCIDLHWKSAIFIHICTASYDGVCNTISWGPVLILNEEYNEFQWLTYTWLVGVSVYIKLLQSSELSILKYIDIDNVTVLLICCNLYFCIIFICVVHLFV